MKRKKIYLFIISVILFSFLFIKMANHIWLRNNLYNNETCTRNIKRIDTLGKRNIIQIQSYQLQDDIDSHDYNKVLESFYLKYKKEQEQSVFNSQLNDFFIDYCYKRRWPFLKFGYPLLVYGSIPNCERFAERSLYFGKHCLANTVEYIFVIEKENKKYLINICFLLSHYKVSMIRNSLRNAD